MRIVENFYIPPIILNKKTRSAGSTQRDRYVCVDGKQRLSSVRAFVQGIIPCHDFRGEKWWYVDTSNGRRRKVLPAETKKMFLSKDFVSFEFKDISQEQEEDLFARVQMGVQLSLAEKMRASTGPWQELARLFVDDFPMVYSLMKDRARAKDFQLTLSCFSQIVEVQHPSAFDGIPLLKTNYNALPKLLSNKDAVGDGIKSRLASVWTTFKDLIELDPDTFTNSNKYLRGVQTFAPVEMVAVAVLISMYSETRNNELLLGDVKAMRTSLREHFVDLRMNVSLWKFIWEYIENLEAIRGAVDGSTVDRRVEQQMRPSGSTTVVNVPSSPVRAKRGRPTARTKPPLVLPSDRSLIVQTEEGAERQPKRKRTDPGATISPLLPLVMHPPGGLDNDAKSRTSWSASPVTGPDHTQPQNPPMPASITAAPSTQMPRQILTPPPALSRGNLTPFPLRNKTPVERYVSPYVPPPIGLRQQARTYTPFTPAATPPAAYETREQPVSQTYDYRASTAPMGIPSPYAVNDQLPGASHWAPIPSTLPHPNSSGNRPSERRTGVGPFAPSVSEQQYSGILKSVTPPVQPDDIGAVPLAQPNLRQTARKTPLRPTRAQYDGAIDLTSDTEQERQSLLQTFNAKALAEKEKPIAEISNTAATSPAEALRNNRATRQRDIPVRDNNPYTKFRQR